MMNASLSHMLPSVALKSDGHVLVLTDSDCDWDEPTRTDIDISTLRKEEVADNWCDGLTFFAILLTLIGFTGMCVQDMADKSAARSERVRLDQNCALTYK